MKELFENETKYSQKEYDIFLEVHQKEYQTSENAFMMYNLIFFGFCAILAFWGKEYLAGTIISIGLIIYLWYKIIRSNKRVEKQKQKFKIEGELENKYNFYKNYFTVACQGKQATIFYFKLYRVVETNKYYYLYLSRDNALLVDKNGFTKGNSLEFSTFIKKKTFMRYKIRTKSSKT